MTRAERNLELLLCPVSLGPDPARRMRNVTEGHAPWVLPNADGFIARILHKPTWERRFGTFTQDLYDEAKISGLPGLRPELNSVLNGADVRS